MIRSTSDSWDDITQPELHFEGARVVVVDDDDGMRELVTTILESKGYKVQEAVSGAELMRIMQSVAVDQWPLDAVDLVVLDNRMPGISGIDAIRRLRAWKQQPPMLLMTAFPEPTVKREAALLGVSILPKPFTVEQLTNAIIASLVAAA